MKLIDRGFILRADEEAGPKKVCSFTTLYRLPSGAVVALFRLGSGKDSADGNPVICVSENNGVEWRRVSSGFETRWKGIPGEVRSAELARVDGQRWTAVLSWFDRSSGKDIFDSGTGAILPSRLLLTESSDSGESWDSCRQLDTGPLAGPSLTGPVLTLPGGERLIFFENFQSDAAGRARVHGAHALHCPGGDSAGRIFEVARDPSDRLFFWDQRQAACPETGRVVSLFWTYNRAAEKDEAIHISWADPGKREWAYPLSTGIAGQIAAPIPLPGGRLLAFYVHRHAPGSMRLAVSNDRGATWEMDRELVVHDHAEGRAYRTDGDYAKYWQEMNAWCFGHPAGIALDDRTVLLAYYAGGNDRCLSACWARVEV